MQFILISANGSKFKRTTLSKFILSCCTEICWHFGGVDGFGENIMRKSENSSFHRNSSSAHVCIHSSHTSRTLGENRRFNKIMNYNDELRMFYCNFHQSIRISGLSNLWQYQDFETACYLKMSLLPQKLPYMEGEYVHIL